MKKLFTLGAYGTLMTAMAMLVYVFYLLFYPFQAIEVNVQPNKVLTPVVVAGGELVFEFDYCRKTSNPTTINRTIRGPRVYALPEYITVGTQGCQKLTVELLVPKEVVSGSYQLVTVNSTRVNPLRIVTTTHVTEFFEVIK